MVMSEKLLGVHGPKAFEEIVGLKEPVLQERYVGFMKTPIRSFEDLECWKAAREVRLFVAREVIGLLLKEEKYRLGDQISARRAVNYCQYCRGVRSISLS